MIDRDLSLRPEKEAQKQPPLKQLWISKHEFIPDSTSIGLLSIKTRQGSITGKTSDISVAGVFILCSVEPELDHRISILLEPPGAGSIRVIGKMVWSDNFDLDDKTVFGMAIRFIAISPEDQKYIATVVTEGLSDQPRP